MVQHPETSLSNEATMGSEMDKLRTSLTDLLKDINYMCSQCVKKSTILLKDTEAMTAETVDVNNVGINKLLSRMQQNVENFTENLKTSITEYQESRLNSIVTPPSINSAVAAPSTSSPFKTKSKLSLLKTGPESMEDFDLDLFTTAAKLPILLNTSSELDASDVESLSDSMENAVVNSRKQISASATTANSYKDVEETITIDVNGDNDSDCEESHKSAELNNFGVPSNQQVDKEVEEKIDLSLNECLGNTNLQTEISDSAATATSSKEVEKTIITDVNGDNDSDSDESNKSVELNNFDVAANQQVDEEVEEKLNLSLNESLNILDSQDLDIKEDIEEEKEKEKCFEFGESEDSQEDIEIKIEPKVEVDDTLARERQIQTIRDQEGRELLKLLTEVTDNDTTLENDKSNEFMLVSSEVVNSKYQKAIEALSELDNDLTSSDTDIDNYSIFSNSSSALTSDGEEPRRTSTPEEKIQTKEFSIKLSRLDSMDESEVDRLCNLNNVNRRKCSNVKWKFRSKHQLKKLHCLSTSSSDSSTSGRSTPSLPDADPSVDLIHPMSDTANLEAEAEIRISNVDSSDADNESDSDTDIEKPATPKRKRKRTILSSDDELSEDKQKKKRLPLDRLLTSPILNDPPENTHRLWSDDDSEDIKPKIEIPSSQLLDTDNPTSSAVKESKVVHDPTVISSDSSELSSSVDSDCEVIEGPLSQDSSSGRGRRNINPVMDDEDLDLQTQMAKTEETQRILRLEEHSRTVEDLQSQHESLVLDVDVKTKSPLITVDRYLSSRLKPHQREGVKFMWEACYESVEILRDKSGTGCILAHCMGLGKTLQVITLIHTLFTYPVTKTNHVLVICPLSTVLNWKNEFKLAFSNLATSTLPKTYFVSQSTFPMKCDIVKKWREETGVLVMGYEAYSILVSDKVRKGVTPELMNIVKKALVDSGPDLVVCDEGHLLKNGKTLKHQALMKIKTKRRIVLTGTPLQNNLTEYYYMLEFVKPHLLGTFKEYSNRFVNPIMNGQYHDSTAGDINLMKKRTHVLNKLLKKTIQRVESSVLKQYLPQILDYTVFITLHPIQASIYRKYIETVKISELRHSDFFKDFNLLKYISLHPFMLKKYGELVKKDGKKDKQRETINLDLTPNDDDTIDQVVLNSLERWWQPFCPFDVDSDINYGSKLKVAIALLREAEQIGDKTLVFSTSLIELDCIEHFLKTQGTTNNGSGWIAGTDYYRMDGTVPPIKRSDLCNSFNDSNNRTVKAFLISHRVGGLGLNLTAANRVILMGANFNPCYDTQSIYRAYRFGQTKKCYVYRLLAMGTMEEKVYQKCVVKLAVASTVIDKFHVDRHYASGDLQAMYQYDFEYPERPLPKVPNDKMLATLLQTINDVYKYHEHQALLENRPEEELNEEEKKLAWDEFNHESLTKNVANAALPPIVPGQQQSSLVQPNNAPETSASSSNLLNKILPVSLSYQREFLNPQNPPVRRNFGKQNSTNASSSVPNHRPNMNYFQPHQENRPTTSGFRGNVWLPGEASKKVAMPHQRSGVGAPSSVNNVPRTLPPSYASATNINSGRIATLNPINNQVRKAVGNAQNLVNQQYPNPFVNKIGNEPVRSAVSGRRNSVGSTSNRGPSNVFNRQIFNNFNNKNLSSVPRESGLVNRPGSNTYSPHFRLPAVPPRFAVNPIRNAHFVQNNRNFIPRGASGPQNLTRAQNSGLGRPPTPVQGEFNYYSNKYITPPP